MVEILHTAKDSHRSHAILSNKDIATVCDLRCDYNYTDINKDEYLRDTEKARRMAMILQKQYPTQEYNTHFYNGNSMINTIASDKVLGMLLFKDHPSVYLPTELFKANTLARFKAE